MLLRFGSQYGEVDIDGSLVAAKAAGAEDIVMLNNGCLCCTVRGDLVRMISELVNKRKGKFDHIVIETTGSIFYVDCSKSLFIRATSRKNCDIFHKGNCNSFPCTTSSISTTTT